MLEAGQTFCGFSIVKPLGNRHAIENYQAKHFANGSLVRLTILSDELLPGGKRRKKFIGAAEQIRSVEHSGIARLLEVGEEGGQAFYVSEFYPGDNFKQLLGKRLLPGRVLRLLRDIGQALSHLHGSGITHGNLKPGNILLGPEDRPILTDVGMSGLLKLDFSLGIDPYYVSPEQVRGGLPGPSSDIYSLGIILYQLLCGQLPFQADSDFRIAMLRLDEPVPKLPGDYLFMQPLLERMLEVEDQKRLSCPELLEELESLIVEADAAKFENRNLTTGQQGENGRKNKTNDRATADIATRIEKTLTERERQRLDEAPVSIEITEPERSSAGAPFPGYLMLLLGVVVGAAIGIAFYIVLPARESLDVTDGSQPEIIRGLEDADRLLISGQTEKARKAYLSLIERNPESPRPYNNLASLYATEGDLDQAQALLNKALETDPDYLAIYQNIGTVYASMARDSYGKALQLQSEKKPLRLVILGQQQLAPMVAKVATPQLAITPARADSTRVEPVVSSPIATIEEPSASLATKPKAVTVPIPKVEADEAPPKPEVVVQAADIKSLSQPESVQVESLSPQQFLQKWAEAWSAQNVEAYLASYAAEYVPPNNQSRQAWQDKRRQRLNGPAFIKVEVETVESISGTGNTARIQLIQGYRSDRYRDRTRKSFVLQRSGATWLIVEERSLGRIN